MTTPSSVNMPTSKPTRCRHLNMRLTEQERVALDTIARRQHMAVSVWARQVLLQAVRYYLQQGTRQEDRHEHS